MAKLKSATDTAKPPAKRAEPAKPTDGTAPKRARQDQSADGKSSRKAVDKLKEGPQVSGEATTGWQPLAPGVIFKVVEPKTIQTNGKVAAVALDAVAKRLAVSDDGLMEIKLFNDSIRSKLEEAHKNGFTIVMIGTPPAVKASGMVAATPEQRIDLLDALLITMELPALVFAATDDGANNIPGLWGGMMHVLQLTMESMDRESMYIVGPATESDDAKRISEASMVKYVKAEDFFGPALEGGAEVASDMGPGTMVDDAEAEGDDPADDPDFDPEKVDADVKAAANEGRVFEALDAIS